MTDIIHPISSCMIDGHHMFVMKDILGEFEIYLVKHYGINMIQYITHEPIDIKDSKPLIGIGIRRSIKEVILYLEQYNIGVITKPF